MAVKWPADFVNHIEGKRRKATTVAGIKQKSREIFRTVVYSAAVQRSMRKAEAGSASVIVSRSS